jgi:hypothetical protein
MALGGLSAQTDYHRSPHVGEASLPTVDTPEPGRVGVGEAEEALRAAVTFYQDQLVHDDQTRAFLKERGLNKESVDRWRSATRPHAGAA